MQFLWFNWDDPKGSAVWSGLIILIGIIMAFPIFWTMLGFGTPNLSTLLWKVVAFGISLIMIGLITLALSAGAWLSANRRRYR